MWREKETWVTSHPFQNVNKNVAQAEQLFFFETAQEGSVTQCFYTGAHLFFAGAPEGSQSKAREGTANDDCTLPCCLHVRKMKAL